MKKTLLLLSLIGGLASVNAATYNISSKDNNLYLGFFSGEDVATKSVLINLGTSADVFNGFNLDLSATNSALSTTYGTNWFNNSEVYWGLIGYDGVSANISSLYVARPTGQDPLVNGGDSTTLTSGDRNTLRSTVASLINSHTSGDASYASVVGSTGNTHGISIVPNGSGAFDAQVGAAYDVFQGTLYGLIGDGLSIQQFTRNGTSYPTAFEGTFGVITQTGGVITVVPEPSTYVLLGLGALLLAMVYRRRA
jgi:hypothetical protein